jgi:predicted aldo/keto reductase-like oxidoreductase
LHSWALDFGVLVKYRSFGKLDWKVSALGFGTMRLPIIGKNQAKVNEPEAIKLIRYAIDQGVNYVDSAFTYHEGNSEVTVGKALTGKYREKAKIATKMPVFSLKRREDLDKILNLQMTRLNTNYIDFYLFHGLNKSLWNRVKELNMLEWAEKQVAKGRLGYLGFSFHDELEVFKEIVDGYDGWTFSQIQYNYLDEKNQAGKSGLKYAASKGLAVVVMEPLAGGLLAVNPPAEIQKEWEKAGIKRAAPEWALQWVWNQPEVSVALSGMNTIQQVKENLESASHSGPNMLNPKEIKLLSKARELYLKCGLIGCTKCRYCSHCPQSIDIPIILAFLNEYSTKRREPEIQKRIKKEFAKAVPSAKRASNCINCGQCEAICPQHLPVRKLLGEATAILE